MADPKYADLPGICIGEPDIYESSDLPESDQTINTLTEDTESEDVIERIHISTSEAFNKFKGKSLNGDKIDFSDRISKRIRTGYDARSGDWELAGEGNKETLMQKYQRLQCEMRELMEEVDKVKNVKDGTMPEDVCLVSEKQVQDSMKKLADLRLEETLGSNAVSSMNDPQGKEIKKLFTQLENFKQTMSDQPEASKSAISKESGVVFELNYMPDQTRLTQTARVADLENRLHRLEAVLGNPTKEFSRLSAAFNNGPLLEVAEHLKATATLLNSAQLDHIEGRVTALSQKMDSISEKKKQLSDNNTEKDKMVVELYEMFKNTENISELLPQTIGRLKSLEGLHHKASDFAKTLSQVETMQSEIATNVQNNKTFLQGVQASFVTNLDEMNKNVIALDARIKAIKNAENKKK